MIIFSDLHLDKDSADVCLNEVLPEICKAARNSDRHVVFLGDWWHLKYRIDVRLQVAVRDELLKWSDFGVTCQILVGNHDQVNIAGRNALEVFDDLPNVQVFSEPTAQPEGYVWLPYRKDLAAYQYFIPLFAGKTVFVHQGFAQCWMNNNQWATEGLLPSAFAGARVFAGHFHRRQQLETAAGTIWYVGSPRQVTAAEAGQPKGFCVVEGPLVEFVDTFWGPRYHQVELHQGESLDLSDVRVGDDVRVLVANESEVARIGNQLDGLEVRHTVTPKVESTTARHAVDSIAGVRGYASVWARERAQDAEQAMKVFDFLVE
jgi:DNA repair exonuclease SbcCD nuclease subunit